VTRTSFDQTRSERAPVPASGVLSAWSAHDWRGGIHVDDLIALECLVVKTENSTYEIILMSPDTAHILVRGGAFFPVFMQARLAGSSLGGSFLKLRSVHVGFRLEISTERGFIITSPVRSVSRAADPTDPTDIM
jgi:hypothetical protein